MDRHTQKKSIRSKNKIKHKQIKSTCWNQISLSKPYIIGYMSVDIGRQYSSNLSQLKYLKEIPVGPLHYDLNHNINAADKRTTDNNNEMISLLLQFLQDQKSLLDLQNKNIDFICYRRLLISIMCNAFVPVEPLIISTCYYNGSIYLCTLDTQRDTIKKQSRTKEEEKFCAWGYKFEQYLLSDQPSTKPVIERPVIENEEFSMFYYASLGSHNLVYGAQIDGMLSTNSQVLNPPEDSNVESNLEYLSNNEFIELKTNRHIENHRQGRNFRRFKLLRCWCQCYLANLKGLLVGFRNEEGVVQRLQWFDTQDIIEHCQNEWSPQIAIDYLNYFLSYIKNCYTTKKYSYPISITFQLNGDRTIDVIENPKCEFLPEWYVNKVD